MPKQEKEIRIQWRIEEYRSTWIHNKGREGDWDPTITEGSFAPEKQNAELQKTIQSYIWTLSLHENLNAVNSVTSLIMEYLQPQYSASVLRSALKSDYIYSQKKISTRFSSEGAILYHDPFILHRNHFSNYRDFGNYSSMNHYWLNPEPLRPPTGRKEDNTYATYYVRPYIEKLFFDEKLTTFSALVDSLLLINEDASYQAFIASLENTNLQKELLFSWDASMEDYVIRHLNALDVFGKSLKHLEEKRQQISDLVAELRTMLSANQNMHQTEKCPKNQFNKLKFKLDFLKKLHRHDADFSIHHDYKRLVANLATILFPPLAIANVIYKLTTNKWLFFNNTVVENKINHIHVGIQLGGLRS